MRLPPLFLRRRSLLSIFDRQYLPRRLRTRSPGTIKGYRVTLRWLTRFLGRPPRLGDLNDQTISEFAADRRTKVGGGTVNRDLYNLLALWRWCMLQGLVSVGPDIELEVVPKLAPIALTREQVERVWRSIALETDCVGEVPGPVFWRAMFLVCWDTGERMGATFSVQRQDVSLSEGWIRFRAGTRKGSAEDKISPIDPQTCSALAELFACYEHNHANYLVFRWSQCDSQRWVRLGRIMERAGLPNSKLYKYHCFRKSSASHVAAGGGNPQAHLGHASGAMTQRYIDPRISGENRSNLEKLFRPGVG